jgi:hypothetical protein
MAALSKATTNDIKNFFNLILSEVNDSPSEQLVLAHWGDFTPGKVDAAIRMIESSMMESGLKRTTIKRFNNVLIECLQNISNHSAVDQFGRMNSFAVVTANSDCHHLICANLILAQDAGSISKKIDRLNQLDKDSLRKLFIETLSNDDFTRKGGAGLGLMTIAKKLDEPIAYQIKDLNEHFAYLILRLKVSH